MFVIFGWGFKTRKKYGIKNAGCLNCNNQSIAYTKITKWITFFFIPVIPYSTSYFKHCTACGQTMEISKGQLFDEFNGVATPLGVVRPEWVGREITVSMEKGKDIIKADYYIDGGLISSAKNGQTVSFTIDGEQHYLSATAEVAGLGEVKSDDIIIELDNLNKTYRLNFMAASHDSALTLVLDN